MQVKGHTPDNSWSRAREVRSISAALSFVSACHAVATERDLALHVYPKLWKLLPHEMFGGAIIELSSFRIKRWFSCSFPESLLPGLAAFCGLLNFPLLRHWTDCEGPVYLDTFSPEAQPVNVEWLHSAKKHGVRDFAAAGVLDHASKQLSYFIFSGLEKRDQSSEPLMRLIAPHLRFAIDAGLCKQREDSKPNRIDSLHHPLSEREHEVLCWIGAGKSNDEIGLILGISPWTVKIHVRNLMAKLNATRRGQAVANAYRLSLMPSLQKQRIAQPLRATKREIRY